MKNGERFMRALQSSIIMVCFLFLSLGFGISVEDVFSWWDDGLIENTDVSDFLELLENGRDDEAVEFAETLGLIEKENKKTKKQAKPFQGSLLGRVSLDFNGNLISHKEEIRLKYSVWSIRGDNEGDWLLRYSRGRYEALGGILTGQNLGILLPFENIGGSFLAFRGENFSLGGLLGVQEKFALMGGIKNLEVWTFFSEEKSSFLFEIKEKRIGTSFWYVPENKESLLRVKTNLSGGQVYKWHFNGLFYFQEEPFESMWLHLPNSVRNSKLWMSEMQSIEINSFLLSAEERLQIPLDSGNVFSQLGVKWQKKKGFFQFLLATFYKNKSAKKEWIFRLEPSLLFSNIKVFGKLRYSFQKPEFHFPRLTFGAQSVENQIPFWKLEFIIPERNASNEQPYQFRNEAGIELEHFRFSMQLVWNYLPVNSWSPRRFGVEGKIFF